MPTKNKQQRKVENTIKINNGSLTYERDNNGEANWYRNGKLIMPYTLERYKFYDKRINGYRQLSKYDVSHPYTPSIDKVYKLADKIRVDKEATANSQIFPYIPKKKIVINAFNKQGKPSVAHGRVYSSNQLDSIAKNVGYLGRSEKDVLKGIALNIKEHNYPTIFDKFSMENLTSNKTTGNISSTNYSYWHAADNEYLDMTKYNGPEVKQADEEWRKFIRKYPDRWSLTGQDSINAENDYQKYLLKKDSLDILRDKRFAYQLAHMTPPSTHYSPTGVRDAIQYFLENPTRYNYGQKDPKTGKRNYHTMVYSIADDLANSPTIQQWWNTTGKKHYQQGYNSRPKKCNGGIIHLDEI